MVERLLIASARFDAAAVCAHRHFGAIDVARIEMHEACGARVAVAVCVSRTASAVKLAPRYELHPRGRTRTRKRRSDRRTARLDGGRGDRHLRRLSSTAHGTSRSENDGGSHETGLSRMACRRTTD